LGPSAGCRQIADQLFIGNKTASLHVTNLFAQLGVRSRSGGRRHGPPGSKGKVPGPAT
jgi:ATP/maltotriose-dependent transcriptional regulator MalT